MLGRLAHRKSVHFVKFCFKGPWFESRHMPGFFQAHKQIMLDLESSKNVSLSSDQATSRFGKLYWTVLIKNKMHVKNILIEIVGTPMPALFLQTNK